jgi:hypothetical protein
VKDFNSDYCRSNRRDPLEADLRKMLDQKKLSQWFNPIVTWVSLFNGLELFVAEDGLMCPMAQVIDRLSIMDEGTSDETLCAAIARLEFTSWRVSAAQYQSIQRWFADKESLGDYLNRTTKVWQYEQSADELVLLAASLMALKSQHT